MWVSYVCREELYRVRFLFPYSIALTNKCWKRLEWLKLFTIWNAIGGKFLTTYDWWFISPSSLLSIKGEGGLLATMYS